MRLTDIILTGFALVVPAVAQQIPKATVIHNHLLNSPSYSVAVNADYIFSYTSPASLAAAGKRTNSIDYYQFNCSTNVIDAGNGAVSNQILELTEDSVLHIVDYNRENMTNRVSIPVASALHVSSTVFMGKTNYCAVADKQGQIRLVNLVSHDISDVIATCSNTPTGLEMYMPAGKERKEDLRFITTFNDETKFVGYICDFDAAKSKVFTFEIPDSYSVEDVAVSMETQSVFVAQNYGRFGGGVDEIDYSSIFTALQPTSTSQQIPVSLRCSPHIVLSFESRKENTYQVEYKNDLQNGSWNVLTKIDGDNTIISVPDMNWTNSPTRFYRVMEISR